MNAPSPLQSRRLVSIGRVALLVMLSLMVAAVLIWQAVTAGGNPDPLTEGISPSAAVMNTGIVVFREGLEAVLVLAALTASMVRRRQDSWKPIATGAFLAVVASLATWFAVVTFIDSINAPLLHLQAATGLLAIVVLLVIMNWFFHKLYWTGWIGLHERRKRAVLEQSGERSAFWGLMLVGLTAVYREGFEIVLFLQNLRLQSGEAPVRLGAAIGVSLTAIVGVLTLVAQRKLPLKQMLVATGVMIGGVLLVMVGASGQAMQQAGWLSMTPLPLQLPAWVGAWFGIYPNVEGLAAQALAATIVLGSYIVARRRQVNSPVGGHAPAHSLGERADAGLSVRTENAEPTARLSPSQATAVRMRNMTV